MNKCIKCGSYAFNLYKEGIDQGNLCDVHYWQGRAHRAEALAQPEQQNCKDGSCDCCWTQPEQKTAIVEAMQAQSEQEPVAWLIEVNGVLIATTGKDYAKGFVNAKPLYTITPQLPEAPL